MIQKKKAPHCRARVIAFVALLVFGSGCVSARMSDHESDRLFRQGRYEEAATRLKSGLLSHGEHGRDALLYLLDIGLSYHSMGKYDESNKSFLKADKIAEIKDYTSLATEGASLLTGENLNDYKGEDFEKVLISTYLAMNFALMGNFEDALVEARRVNHKLYMMVSQGQRKYKQSAFARYISAIMYEAENNYNDAYIDYKHTRELVPEFPGLGQDLWRCAWQLRMHDEMEKWDNTFQLTASDHEKAKLAAPRSGKGEIVVFYENGISPQKRPNPAFRELPKFYPRANPVKFANIEIKDSGVVATAPLDDIESVAIQNLDEKYAGLIAKRIAGVAAKKAVGAGIGKATNSPLLGALTEIALFVSDQADIRSWNLLPKDLQVARVIVEPGTYSVQARPVGGAELPPKLIQVSAGKKVFVNFRYMP